MQTDFCKAYILHSRALGEDKLILQLLMPEAGRLSAVVRKRQGKHKLALQPFQLFQINLAGRLELKTIKHIEEDSPAYLYTGRVLYSAMYVNELICRLWPDNLASEHLFCLYKRSLEQLWYAQMQNLSVEPCLREFEFALLAELGQPIDWQHDANGEPLEELISYQWQAEYGFVAHSSGIKGQYLINIGNMQWQDDYTRYAAKQLSRLILTPLLGGKPLASRALFDAS